MSASSWSWVTYTNVMPDLALQTGQLELQLLAQLGVERAERLVEQQHPRAQHERPGECHALLLTARQLVRLALGELLEAHETQCLGRACRRLIAREVVHEAQAERDVALDGQVGEQRIALEHRVDRSALGWHAGDVLAVEQHPAGIGVLEAPDHAQRGGLAAAARAEQREELAGADRDVDVLQHGVLAVGLRELYEVDRAAHCGSVWQSARDRAPVVCQTDWRVSLS